MFKVESKEHLGMETPPKKLFAQISGLNNVNKSSLPQDSLEPLLCYQAMWISKKMLHASFTKVIYPWDPFLPAYLPLSEECTKKCNLENAVSGRKFFLYTVVIYFDSHLKTMLSQCQECSKLGIFFVFSNLPTPVFIKRPQKVAFGSYFFCQLRFDRNR